MLSWNEIETKAIAFSKTWRNCKGDERQEAQTFEKDFMSVFGVDWHEGLHEYQVYDYQGRVGYVDYLLPGKILIEMKSKGESLVKAYNQGYDYAKCLKPDEYPELLMVSDFNFIQVTNLKTMQTFKKFKVSELKNKVRMLGTLAGYNSEVTFKTDIEVNTDASYKMAKLHDKLKENGYEGRNLEVYLVRLLFCLFAEDTGIFESGAFENYILSSKEDGSDLSSRMISLFSILNTPENKRMKTLPNELKKFRYINGKLFSEMLPPAFFDHKMRSLILDCCNFDWGYISPAIFGAMFQGVMNQKERRELGAHYTSEKNIMKLIKPLFLDDLWDEFNRCKISTVQLEAFHNKIASLYFFDPACGCGNFLIITYRELRLLEFELLKMLYDNKQMTIIETLCKVSVNQFYGIEVEEFPCQIAYVGLLLMKHQMDIETSNYFGINFIDFPITDTANIVHGNALKMSWEDVVSKDKLSYIIGNPPFIGARFMNTEQKEDILTLFDSIKNAGNLDYVTGWYKKASEYIIDTNIKSAFVSTNSIVQGEQSPILWRVLFEKYNIHIDFAYRTFKWGNEAKGKAAVHCVIIGFSSSKIFSNMRIFLEDETVIYAENINPYLVNADNVFIESRKKAICNVPTMCLGNMPNDGGYLLFSDEEKEEFLSSNPNSEKWFKKFVGSHEYINSITRWCLWLEGTSPSELKSCKGILERISKVREFRLASKRKATQKLADSPMNFGEIRQPKGNYILVPRHSSEKRKYLPIGFMEPDVICGDANLMIPEATIYEFGILISNVHMVWMRTICGRIKSDYRYSNNLVYNNFPWPSINEKHRELIERAAWEVLYIREKYPNDSLANLYDPLLMPLDLLRAHRNLDKEVYKAYGIEWESEEMCMAKLIEMYLELIENKK
ncbi:DNA methyltransferase [Clostridium cylindrosporum]|uniref:site-specific DNA-methyltransferase (adenine-specific) n=1 Tax=Clostridium cylindrosporum DSM 605 TaxID=1121307 RepID=A0A0J8G1H2_CLOCY|nr:DNA methyltransferase [Clostridium cylindrosporum]KMT21611.1 putative DNA methyltransferase YeeA [Clostridium cylindrosporum DSM 605]